MTADEQLKDNLEASMKMVAELLRDAPVPTEGRYILQPNGEIIGPISLQTGKQLSTKSERMSKRRSGIQDLVKRISRDR